VSEADLEIDLMLRERLLAARPGYGWLSEETEDAPDRLAADALFIVDPIDGTRAFLEGQKGFAHALAIARGGRVTAAVVHLPLLERTYTARAGGGAFLNDRPLVTPMRTGLLGARVLASRGQLDPAHWPGGLPAVERHFRPSLAWRLCLVAEGAFHGTVTLRDTWDWDTAAATLIVEEAGARVTDRHGTPLAFNTPAPRSAGLIAGPAGVHAGFLTALGVPGTGPAG
jgi:myo-inositol-1(or 4)-monophosphatase